MVSASFAHFEPFHFLFNAMSLYNLGFLEDVFGSLPYAFLSLHLVLVTMAICLLFDYVAIHYLQRPQAAYGLGVGYSCVLFAWMVAASVRQRQFCPIFVFPSFCFPTYVVPYVGLAVNAGPLVLLLVTKVVIPQSSFLGHLSGIVIGYPLAWNWLDWLSPPVFTALACVVFLALRGRLLLQGAPGYGAATSGLWGGGGSGVPPLESYLSPDVLLTCRRLRACSVALWLAVLPAWWMYGLLAAAPRAVLAWMLFAASVSRRCMLSGAGSNTGTIHTTSTSSSDSSMSPEDWCTGYTALGLALSVVLSVGDSATLGAGALAWPLLQALSRGLTGARGRGGDGASAGAATGLLLTAAWLLAQAASLLALLQLASELPPGCFVSRMCTRAGLGAVELAAAGVAGPAAGGGGGGGGGGGAAGGGGGWCSRMGSSLWGSPQHARYSPVPTESDGAATGAFLGLGRGNRLGSGAGSGSGSGSGSGLGSGSGFGGGGGRGGGGGSVGMVPLSQGRKGAKEGPTVTV